MEQEPFLFSRTIRENITYGVGRNVPQSEIEAAAQAAAIHDVIMTFPDGYNTLVGEKGVTLSGGQKQRVAIARTLLKNPRILILDDSTSSVDLETEQEIREALERLMQNRTTFIIAHRVQSVMNADLILVLDHGRIVQRGKHEELLQQPGIYRQIYDIQTKIEAELEKEVGSVEVRCGMISHETLSHRVLIRSVLRLCGSLSVKGVTMSDEIEFEEEEFNTQFNGQTIMRILAQTRPHWKWVVGFLVTVTLVAGVGCATSRTCASRSSIGASRRRHGGAGAHRRDLRRDDRACRPPGCSAFIYLAGVLGERVRYDLRKKTFNHLQDLSLTYYSKTPVGWIMSRVTCDTVRIAELVTWGMLDVTWGVVNIITAFAFMLAINWQLALLVLLIIPVLLFVAAYFSRRSSWNTARCARSTPRSPARTTRTSPACAWSRRWAARKKTCASSAS